MREMVRPVDLINPGPTLRWRIPGLEAFRDRLFRTCRAKIFQTFRKNVQILEEKTETTAHDSYLAQNAQGTLYVLTSFEPIRGITLFCLSPELLTVFVDDLFGAGDIPSTVRRGVGTEPSNIERRIGSRLGGVIMDSIAETFEPHVVVKPTILRIESHQALASIADAKDPVCVMSCSLQLPSGTGKLSIAIPYRSLEPYKDSLSSPMTAGKSDEEDDDWSNAMSDQVDGVPIDVSVTVGEIQISLADFSNIAPGDVLPARIYRRASVVSGDVSIGSGIFGADDLGSAAVRLDGKGRMIHD